MVASFRTREGGFRYRISLPYRRSLFFTPNASENASRTTGSLFEHRMRIPYRRRPFLVPGAVDEQRKRPPETSSALTGRRKWWKGPERTKRAESGSEAICCRCGTSNFTKERGRPFRRPYVSIRPIRHHILNLTLITAGLSLSLSSRPVLSMTYLLSGSVVSLCPYSR